MNKIYQELLKHGATSEQSKYYVRRVEECVKLSKGLGHSHHILPRNCGWWKKYDEVPWNRAAVTLELHISLHADLCQIFPDNQSLKRALKITVSLLRPSNLSAIKKSKREDIIRWYSSGSSARKISNRLKVDDTTITRWLKEWGIRIRTYGEAAASEKTVIAKRRRKEIEHWYESGRSSLYISKKIGVNWQTIVNWLRSWGVQIRRRGWRGNGWNARIVRGANKKPV